MAEETFQNPSDDELRKIYDDVSTIAVVGASANEEKPSFAIPRQLQGLGYRIVPVNPRGGEILGERVYRSLDEVDVPVDVVDVFRPAEETPEIARQAADLEGRCQGAVAPGGDRVRGSGAHRPGGGAHTGHGDLHGPHRPAPEDQTPPSGAGVSAGFGPTSR